MPSPKTDPAPTGKRPDPALPAATSALQAAGQRWKRRLPRTLVAMPLICGSVALILTALDGRGLGYKLVYSMCIGFLCMGIVDATRLGSAWVADRLRSARGRAFDDSEAAIGWRGVAPGVLLALLFGPQLGLWLGDRLTGFSSPSMLDWSHAGTRITLAISLVTTIISVIGLSTFERLASAKLQAQAAQRQAAENQLALLQSQLEPHMLFNTLANLRVLITLDPPRAQAMLDRLIAFLRATLNASRNATQPLAAEFAHLDDYLALMAVRMGPRLAVTLSLPPELAQWPVPPLLLQPLVENAIKHGLEPKVDGGRIEVSARRAGSTLLLRVRDTGVGLNPAAATAGTAFGLQQVRARLATLHGAQAALSLQPAADAEGGVVAEVQLPMNPTADGAKP